MFENPEHNGLAILIVLAGLALLLIVVLCTGAIRLFIVAIGEGGIGIIIYILLWGLLSPLMAVLCILAGVLYWSLQLWVAWQEYRLGNS
jgi:hypothetical protein